MVVDGTCHFLHRWRSLHSNLATYTVPLVLGTAASPTNHRTLCPQTVKVSPKVGNGTKAELKIQLHLNSLTVFILLHHLWALDSHRNTSIYVLALCCNPWIQSKSCKYMSTIVYLCNIWWTLEETLKYSIIRKDKDHFWWPDWSRSADLG